MRIETDNIFICFIALLANTVVNMLCLLLALLICGIGSVQIVDAASIQCADGRFYDNSYGSCLNPPISSDLCAGNYYDSSTGAICVTNSDGSQKGPICPVNLSGTQVPGSFSFPYGVAGNSQYGAPYQATPYFRNFAQYSYRFRCTTPNAENPIRQEQIGQLPSETDTLVYWFSTTFNTNVGGVVGTPPTAADGSNQNIDFNHAFGLRPSSSADSIRVINAGVQATAITSTSPDKNVVTAYFTHPDIYEGNCWVPFDLKYVSREDLVSPRLPSYIRAQFSVQYTASYFFSPWYGNGYPVFCDTSLYSNPSGDYRTWIPLPISPSVCSVNCAKRSNQRCNTAGNGCECIDGLLPVFDGDGLNIVSCKKEAYITFENIGLDPDYMYISYLIGYGPKKGICIGSADGEGLMFCRRYAGAYYTG
jgi:hypothetical protein